jgi:hypothetical protein
VESDNRLGRFDDCLLLFGCLLHFLDIKDSFTEIGLTAIGEINIQRKHRLPVELHTDEVPKTRGYRARILPHLRRLPENHPTRNTGLLFVYA